MTYTQHTTRMTHKQSEIRRVTRVGAILGTLISVGATGCINRPVGESAPETHNVFLKQMRLTKVDKIDVLFMVDNSLSMGDKQQVLAAAVPQLLRRLTSPDCVHPTDKSVAPVPMEDPTKACPSAELQREFAPVKDIHIGVITSSLGDTGGSTCNTANRDGSSPDYLQAKDDKAWLLGSLPRAKGSLSSDFLSWSASDAKDFANRIGPQETQFRNYITAATEHGCGIEMSLESWYRFLIDPEPPQKVDTVTYQDPTTKATSVSTARIGTGPDETLLKQRKEFLRPDSLLAIVMLTDENDCSLKDNGASFLIGGYLRPDGTLLPLKGASAACKTNPNDRCCYSCDAQAAPQGCPVEDNCTGPTPTRDIPNLRCFDQKRRYGFDFLFPTQRYVNALRLPKICPYQNYGTLDCSCKDEKGGNLEGCVPGAEFKNPIFDPQYNGTAAASEGRTGPEMVFLAGIVGVPWQDIAESGTEKANTDLRYKLSSQIDWDLILPRADGTPARDPLMHEQVEPRSGTHPITNEPIGLPTSGNQRQLNSVNWHDWVSAGDELQYACVFDLSQPLSDSTKTGSRDCEATCADDDEECKARMGGCPCTFNKDKGEYPKSPLCQASDGSYGKMQYAAKAYPGTRELEVLRGHNASSADNSIVASICPKDLDWNHRLARGYGYNPAVQSLVDRLKTKLTATCLPRTVVPEDDKLPCAVIEAIPSNGGEWRECEKKGRAKVTGDLYGAVLRNMRENQLCDAQGKPGCTEFALCNLPELKDDMDPAKPLTKCQNEVGFETNSPVPGFCYIDPAQGIGNKALVQECPSDRQRMLRIVGNGDDKRAPAPSSWTFIACTGSAYTANQTPPVPGPQ